MKIELKLKWQLSATIVVRLVESCSGGRELPQRCRAPCGQGNRKVFVSSDELAHFVFVLVVAQLAQTSALPLIQAPHLIQLEENSNPLHAYLDPPAYSTACSGP